MKKFAALLMALLMVLPMVAMAEAVASPSADAFTSASVSNYYAQYALTGDDLMNAVNGQTGTYIVCTVNPDGTPNAAYFIFSMVKHGEEYYLQLGLAENQSKANLNAGSKGVAVYAANPTGAEGAPAYSVSGARIWFEALEDEAIAAELAAGARPGAAFYKITAVRPLG